jgi:preprotein translocase subunit YajC
MMSSMKKSDKVMTAGGIIGTIAEMTDDEVVLRLEEGKVRVSRSSIQAVIKPAVVPAGKAEPA